MSAHEGLGSAMLRAQMDKAAADVETDKDPLNDELQAMRTVARTLEKLDYDARQRVLNWLCHRNTPPPPFSGGELALAGRR